MPPTAKKKRALSRREAELLDSLATVATLVATPGLSNAQIIARVIEQLSDDHNELDEHEARRWVRKAREYIVTGAAAHVDDARMMYVQRLEVYIQEMWKRAIRDKREVISEPTGPADGPNGRRKMVVTRMKIIKDCIDPAIMQLILKAEREKAHVLGVRPTGLHGRVSNTVNVQNNILNTDGARQVAQLGNDRLLELAGLAGGGQGESGELQILPDAPGPAEPVPEGLPSGDPGVPPVAGDPEA